jgi:hypothetical protein
MRFFFYKLIFNHNKKYLDDKYKSISGQEKQKILDLNTFTYFDYEEFNNYFFYTITTPIEMSKYTKILKDNFINHILSNISDDVLKFRIDIETDLSDKVNDTNLIKWEFFIEDINEWILENLTIDIVLDHINEVGIDNIADIEKLFLKNYSVRNSDIKNKNNKNNKKN